MRLANKKKMHTLLVQRAREKAFFLDTPAATISMTRETLAIYYGREGKEQLVLFERPVVLCVLCVAL
jgi:hypothetical protein